MKARPAKEDDFEQINEVLYNWHSGNGFSTFVKVEPLDKQKEWFRHFDCPKHIAFVSEDKNQISEVACSFAYREGGVFSNTIETSIYLHPDWMGQSLGSTLYKKLFSELEGKN